MKRFNRTRLALFGGASLIGGLGAIALVLGAVGVLAGPSPSALQAIGAIPVCANCNIVVVSKDAAAANYTTVDEAMAYIATQPHNASNPWLVYIAPGIYELAAPLQMLEFVDIQGAGEGITSLTRGGSDTNPSIDNSSATVSGANNAELRFLTVTSSGGLHFAIAISNSGASPKLNHVTATASGGVVNYGVYNKNSSPTMTNVTATGSGGQANRGLVNDSSSPTIRGSTIEASGGEQNFGILNFGDYSRIFVDSSRIIGNSSAIRNLTLQLVRVHDSLLDGPTIGEIAIICIDSFDENLAELTVDCD